MQLQISENAITVPVPAFDKGWFHTISNESKVTYIQNRRINLLVENNATKNAYKNCSSSH